ncbi:hypothetical protein GCM10009850_112620 [Nonomuraea monospora]|uniref:Uncharacterized protein n=1 Tax=Nonomuraea monospora TaxID=568818 RepID=A0ABN3D1V4_9ACTN
MSVEDFHSEHPEPLKDGHTKITWSPSTNRAVSIRVRRHTCGCVPTSYELCAAAGLAFIRRIVRSSAGAHVSESPWLPRAEADKLWTALLEGWAR